MHSCKPLNTSMSDGRILISQVNWSPEMQGRLIYDHSDVAFNNKATCI